MSANGVGKMPRSLLWVSAGLVIVGAAIGSPVGAVTVAILAGLCTLWPVIAGPTRPRVVGLIVLAAAIALAVDAFPAARREMGAYRERALKAPHARPVAPVRNP